MTDRLGMEEHPSCRAGRHEVSGAQTWRWRVEGCVVLLALGLLFACGGAGRDVEPGEESSPAAAEESTGVDACSIVTQDDASALFGEAASPQAGTPVIGGTMLGQCLWTWDTETSNQLLQFSIWVAAAYAPPDDAEPFDLGEKGYVRTHPLAGVDVTWLQGGRMISLAYSTIGPDAPPATSKVEEVEALARQVSARL